MPLDTNAPPPQGDVPPSGLPPVVSNNSLATVTAIPASGLDLPRPAETAGSLPLVGLTTWRPTASLMIVIASLVLLLGLVLDNQWVIGAGMLVNLLVALKVLWRPLVWVFIAMVTQQQNTIPVAIVGVLLSFVGYQHFRGHLQWLGQQYTELNWDAIGAIGEGIIGAVGQILIALLALWVAWRQYIIEKELTTQQNRITQQQTIDTYFQGISDLVMDDEGLLEDWPLERAIAEGRTAAILSSVDGNGKAKILRFLSHSRLLTPLKRDRRLGRPILDGTGGYAEDRLHGIRVIDLRVMLAKADLSYNDLRWTDLSDSNLIEANLNQCDLVKANLARTILFNASLQGTDLEGARLFYGNLKEASPRSRTHPPDYETGAYTGAVVENADFTSVRKMSEEQRYYCCAWGGSKTRSTIPGGCEGIPNQLGR
ncbi:hypothetical protein DO97_00350 [Neosynechococcus sphagnicola sy1]|uniref:Low-complexity protein n=1 Tax=Neosynechococcus sphagnicola sy1 TaxID=1497020 RepID=A0A098TTA2_9CYAN|nr:pentapeptide repeat-containing protein [Neosynechococcus sphagnicola]KGF74013.1 hypothetical protein DO97_00350 [Neosynechococcus sphagnicola sy1]